MFPLSETSKSSYHLFKAIPVTLGFLPFKVIVLGSHTAPETVPRLFIGLMERGYWKRLQLVGYGLFNVRYCPKITSFEVRFHTWEEEKVTSNHVGCVKGL
ncbi:hypothetical protein AVEN_229177-1 [Araneus ventricosus]|uniref:Uncharacterized protein n=1 Tax=Araneus ventricosus TaxID=182803 RepID=A0A4Y2JM67_ARAVE|nr:hypothetical protein AVEN_229177-1 [Araneus ventricosus]